MVRPVLRSLGTIQIDGVVFTEDGLFAPHDPENFGVLADAYIGADDDGPGADLFHFNVCSPSWMAYEVSPGEHYWLRHYLLLRQWDYDSLRGAVTQLCAGIDEPDWHRVAEKLSLSMHWEFEDYYLLPGIHGAVSRNALDRSEPKETLTVRPILDHLETIDDVEFTKDGRFSPPNKEHFAVNVTASIGGTAGPGKDLFHFVVCSPSWMENEVAEGEYYWLRHYLLLTRWDYDLIVKAVTKLCTSVEGPDWKRVAGKLGRYMQWEFEGVQEEEDSLD